MTFEPPPPGQEPPALPSPDPVAALAPPGRTYELPTARRVVSAGLQLALAASGDLRRASIYIGLLALGAFGPTVLFALATVASLGPNADEILGGMFSGQPGLPTDPALINTLLQLELLAILGFVLFLAISIDAQAIAISLLAGRAGDRPLALWQAVRRARQVFWRLLGATLLVGIAAAIIQAVVVALLRAFGTGPTFAGTIGPVIAAVLEAPFAYAASGIVLGDVGAIEAINRSFTLFRARPVIAVVVMLFTLVTAAIEVFALGGGLDLLVRAGELLHAGLTGGPVAFVLATVLVLAAVTAFGSLLFTVSAIVAAPQVAGFLGLTFYAGGLDVARGDGVRPHGFPMVTRPMLLSLVAIGLIAAAGIAARA